MKSSCICSITAHIIHEKYNKYMDCVNKINEKCFSPISNVHRDTSSVDYITITYNYNN